jgi:hypothetical protein
VNSYQHLAGICCFIAMIGEGVSRFLQNIDNCLPNITAQNIVILIYSPIIKLHSTPSTDEAKDVPPPHMPFFY